MFIFFKLVKYANNQSQGVFQSDIDKEAGQQVAKDIVNDKPKRQQMVLIEQKIQFFFRIAKHNNSADLCMLSQNQQINVAIVSDFCYPFLGGVQIHILKLAQHLLTKVNKVIIITHHYPGYIGVKYHNEIKFYYLKLPYHKNLNIIYGTYCLNHFLFKQIFQTQKINLVHGHSSISPLSQEAILCAGVLGIRVLNTEHSLYTVKEMFDIHTSKCVQILTIFYNKAICVSRTTRNNFLLRSFIDPQKLIVIPNAAQIKSKPKIRKPYHPQKPIKIIFVGRLTYRRGVDLLIDILQEFLLINNFVLVKIIGQGVKMPVLKKFVQQKKLSKYIQIMGSVENQKVIEIMQDCDIFINTPLTESFGIALIEAALEGLLCVSTQVGGITEVLPNSLLITTKPTKNDFIRGLLEATKQIKSGRSPEHKKQLQLVSNYNWQNVSNRVYDVYRHVFELQKPIGRKQVAIMIFKKQKLVGYLILVLYLVLCLINDAHDWLRKRRTPKKD